MEEDEDEWDEENSENNDEDDYDNDNSDEDEANDSAVVANAGKEVVGNADAGGEYMNALILNLHTNY